MSEPQNKPDEPSLRNTGWNKQTSFGEPMWVDVLKSIWSGLVMLFFTLIIGGALAVAIIAPWGRASHDCSIYCVLRNYFKAWWEPKPGASVARVSFRLHKPLLQNKKPPGSFPKASAFSYQIINRQVASSSGLSVIR